MRLMEVNWRPGDRQLRQFGLLVLVLLPLAGWWLGHGRVDVVALLAAAGALAGLIGLVRPQWLRVPFVGLSLITWPIGLVVGEIALLCVYFGVMTPLGLLRRWCRRDGLQRRIDRTAETYWGHKRQPRDLQSYSRQW